MSRRAASLRVFARTLVRATLLAVLALEGWGTLLLLLTLGHAVSRGPWEALGLLLPSPGSAMWGWVGAFATGLALLSWTGLAVFLVVSGRTPPGATVSSEASASLADGAPSPPPALPADPNEPPD